MQSIVSRPRKSNLEHGFWRSTSLAVLKITAQHSRQGMLKHATVKTLLVCRQVTELLLMVMLMASRRMLNCFGARMSDLFQNISRRDLMRGSAMVLAGAAAAWP